VSRSFDDMPLVMANLSRRVQKNVNTIVKKVSKAIGDTVIDTTRVDTGKARSNWIATLNAPSISVIPPYAPGNKLGINETANASAAKSQHKQVFGKFDTAKNADVFITNRVEYIGFLNDGGKHVSPGNMVEKGIQAGKVKIRGLKILSKT